MTTTSMTMTAPAGWNAEEIAFILDVMYCANVDGDDPDEQGSFIAMRALGQPRDRSVPSWPSLNGAWFEVRLRFLGVRDVRLDRFGPGPQQVMGFSIDDYSDRGWDGVTYKIGDYEDDRIAFYCSRIIVESRVPLEHRPMFLPLEES